MATHHSQEADDGGMRETTQDPVPKERGGDNQGKECIYDFRRPNVVSKEQLFHLQTAHEGFAKTLSTYFSTLLRTTVHVQVLSVDQVMFSEFSSAMSTPDCVWIFDVQDGGGKGLLEVSPDLVLIVIDRVFGGMGQESGGRKSLSVIEQNVAWKIMEKCLRIYNEAWMKTARLDAKLVEFESNPQYLQIARGDDIVVVHFLEVQISEATFPMNICFPYKVIDGLIEKKGQDEKKENALIAAASEEHWKIEHALKQGKMDFSVLLGEATLTIGELLNLENDDVLILDHKINDLCLAHVGRKDQYLGTVGVAGNQLAFRVVDVIGDKAELSNALGAPDDVR